MTINNIVYTKVLPMWVNKSVTYDTESYQPFVSLRLCAFVFKFSPPYISFILTTWA